MNIITFDDKVALNENPSVPDINKVKDSDLNQLKNALNTTIWDLIYPVGSIVIKADNDDYSSWLGFTWERTLVGKVAVGIDSAQTEFDTIGETGGEKTHQLTEQELPNITGSWTIHGQENGTIFYNATGKATGNVVSNKYKGIQDVPTGASSLSSPGFNFGGNHAHNNLQPYQVVAYWKRTA